MPEIRKIPGKKVPFLLVGTKKDLREKGQGKGQGSPVSEGQGQEVAKRLKAAKYMECSAVTEEGLAEITAIFEEATRYCGSAGFLVTLDRPEFLMQEGAKRGKSEISKGSPI